jgi:hypothetical protein
VLGRPVLLLLRVEQRVERPLDDHAVLEGVDFVLVEHEHGVAVGHAARVVVVLALADQQFRACRNGLSPLRRVAWKPSNSASVNRSASSS